MLMLHSASTHLANAVAFVECGHLPAAMRSGGRALSALHRKQPCVTAPPALPHVASHDLPDAVMERFQFATMSIEAGEIAVAIRATIVAVQLLKDHLPASC